MLMNGVPLCGSDGLRLAPLNESLRIQGCECRQGRERGDGEGRSKLVFVVENFDAAAWCWEPANVPDTTDTAPNSPIAWALHRITPVQQTPLHVGQPKPEHAPARGAKAPRQFLPLPCLASAGSIRAPQKGNRNEYGLPAQCPARRNDLHVVLTQPARTRPAIQAEDQHVNQPGDHRGHRERQIQSV